jgi:formylglycine-generating enzyme required for sulfatase activity
MTVSSFSMGKYEVTWDQWACVRYWGKAHGYSFSDRATNQHIGNGTYEYGRGDEPVIFLDWHNAVIWCNAASERFSLKPVYFKDAAFSVPIRDNSRYWSGDPQGSVENPYVDWAAGGYRLPTEAEWEYCARFKDGASWTPASYASGATAGDAAASGIVAWYEVNSGGHKHSAGGKQPNALGLYDMSGNAFEWCWDIFGAYPTTVQIDYRGCSYGVGSSDRIERGGDWYQEADKVSCGARFSGSSGTPSWGDGFRVARSVP